MMKNMGIDCFKETPEEYNALMKELWYKAQCKIIDEKLKKEASNFNNWVAASTAILNAKNSLNEVDRDDIALVDTFEIDLAKAGIDVEQWEEPIKPVKIIMSIVKKDIGNFNFSVEFGNMVLLMEDGTFKISE